MDLGMVVGCWVRGKLGLCFKVSGFLATCFPLASLTSWTGFSRFSGSASGERVLRGLKVLQWLKGLCVFR